MISQPPIQLITHSPVCKRSILLTIAYNSRTNEYPSPFPTLRILSPEKGAPMKWNIESGTISASFGNGPLNRTNISDSWIRVCVFNRILHESCSRAETNILNNTGKLKSDIYRRGEKWMDFPVENPRWILDTQCRSGYLDTGWYPALFGNRSDFQKEP